jgi:ketosteroid isomerase-like protein
VSTDLNKATAAEFFARFSASDIPGALATMTDDATWLIPGKPELSPAAGLYQKDRITKLFYTMLKQLKSGLKMTVKGMVAEGDRVAVEVVSEGDLKNGRQYRQEYHMLLEFRAGKVCAVREYLDTQHAHAVWIAPEGGKAG